MTTDAQSRLVASAIETLATGKAMAAALLLSCLLVQGAAAEWTVATGNHLLLDTSRVGFSVGELSGVTFLGDSPALGKHRFMAVQDNGNGLITFDATFDLSGNMLTATALGRLTLNVNLDYEGIAQAGETVFLSDENGPGVREFDASGTEIQVATIPAIFTDNRRNNLGFESLAKIGTTLWTGTESALTVDGDEATSAEGTTVRLLELDTSGGLGAAGAQFAYTIDQVHGSGVLLEESGLVELVAMPDGALLALERSAFISFTDAGFLSSLYEIDFEGATDVSQAPFDAGLTDQTFTPVSKGNALWSEPAGGGMGQNLEGLTVGPRLPNGDYILLGVVDDGGSVDPLSHNTVVTLLASPTPAIGADPDTGDFDQNGVVDGDDFLTWQRGIGVPTLAGLNDGDGNHDGTVTGLDLAVWESQYGTAASLSALVAVPEPACGTLLLLAGVSSLAIRRRGSTALSPPTGNCGARNGC